MPRKSRETLGVKRFKPAKPVPLDETSPRTADEPIVPPTGGPPTPPGTEGP